MKRIQVDKKRALRIAGWVCLGVFGLGLLGTGMLIWNREALLREILDRGIRKARRDYGLAVQIDSARFTGLSTVAFSRISVVPEQRDSLVRIDRVEVGVSPWPLLMGRVAVSSLNLENGLVHVVRRDSLTNIDFLLKRKKDSTSTSRRRADLSDLAENLVDNLLAKIPDDMNVRNLEFRLTDNTVRQRFLTESAVIDDEELTSTIRVNGNESIWHLNGMVDGNDQEANVRLFAEGKPLEIPYLKQRYNLLLQADTLGAELRDVDRAGGELRILGAGFVRNLRLNHPAVALNDVLVPQASMNADLFVGENYLGLDSTSVVRLGQAEARPFLKYTLSPNKVYDLALHTDSQEAQHIFDAFPQGLFESLEGIKVAGKLKYDLRLHLDSALPDSVQFEADLIPENFKIVQFGKVDFRRINGSFRHEVYEKDKLVRSFIVGPENPDFVPLEQISPDLRNALLTSEDYNFFTHKGFNEKAFRVSIATNYKTRKFKRGGSTVSMQLVKNVFLNRNKTLSRKAEEILIVWLIENQRLVSKSRMYEVYLNLIEWGRDIYGVSEASRYYFAKHPSELGLGESIFLAFVVPSPKRALNWFLPDGTLQSRNVRGYFRLIGRIMASRGLTQPDSGAYGFYDVRLREGLRRDILPDDSIDIDSTFFEPDMNLDLDGGLFEDRAEEPQAVTPTPATPAPTSPADTVKTRRQLRQERRERKRREKEQQRQLEETGIEGLRD